jgi:hypothetical protein
LFVIQHQENCPAEFLKLSFLSNDQDGKTAATVRDNAFRALMLTKKGGKKIKTGSPLGNIIAKAEVIRAWEKSSQKKKRFILNPGILIRVRRLPFCSLSL